MTLKIHNTLTRRLEDFQPIEPGHVRMYVCGMTIYDLCHIGHARMMMAFDVVQRWLKVSGYRVTYVRNITDIDDKIIKRAVERGITLRALTDEMTAAMHLDIGLLGIEPPTLEPRATEYVPQMLSLIDTLQQKGLAYQADNGDVNYAVRKFAGYGKLSGKSLDDLRAGERVAVASDKNDPLDFVLWKSAKPDEPAEAQWASAYGAGRPGWHIECSAMSCATLGETFDIHGGGADLQFPHHENEIAQSEGATGQPLARFWVHNGFVRVDNEKMSKSLGNFFTIREVLAKYDPETVRFFILRAHYRSALNYSDVHLDDARGALKRLYTALQSGDALLRSVGQSAQTTSLDKVSKADGLVQLFIDAMNDDFNTPGALSLMFEMASDINSLRNALVHSSSNDDDLRLVQWRALREKVQALRSLGATLGLLQNDPQSHLQGGADLGDSSNIEALIAQRTAAKQAKDFTEADRIRKLLLEQGIVLKDGPAGTTWERA